MLFGRICKNVRAKASIQLEEPQDVTLRRILSFDSDHALAAVTGVRIEMETGWTEAALQGDAQVCLIPVGMETQTGADGTPFVPVTMNGVSLSFK